MIGIAQDWDGEKLCGSIFLKKIQEIAQFIHNNGLSHVFHSG